jgi:hypothetical protein
VPAVTVDAESARGVSNVVRFVGGTVIGGAVGERYMVLEESGDLIAIYTRLG